MPRNSTIAYCFGHTGRDAVERGIFAEPYGSRVKPRSRRIRPLKSPRIPIYRNPQWISYPLLQPQLEIHNPEYPDTNAGWIFAALTIDNAVNRSGNPTMRRAYRTSCQENYRPGLRMLLHSRQNEPSG